jgi:uncharacterized membrane protein YgcG
VLPAQRKLRTARRVFSHAFALILFIAAPGVAFGQKDLYWKALDVAARLDVDGKLHVVERHTMVFTGDWNGGERSFRVEPGQTLTVEGMRHLDPSGPRPMVRGNLDLVDHYDLVNRTTLRWRSRLPSDPSFDNTELDYEITYTLAGILLKRGDAYVLDHNFALPAANKRIESLTVDLDIDPAWTVPPGFVRHQTAKGLEPGANYTVHAELGRAAGAGAPSTVRRGTTRAMRAGLFVVLLVAVILLAVAFQGREAALGRFRDATPPEGVDEAWLEKALFTLLPEEAGALWDDTVGAPEVTAVLAGLTAEKKLETVVEGKELTMRLKAPIQSFSGYEKELLEALFFDGRKETSTSDIQRHYRSTGFDPASKIEPGLRDRLAKHADFEDRSGRPHRGPTFALFSAGVAILAFEGITHAMPWGTILGAAIPIAFWWVIGAFAAMRYQKRMDKLGPWSISLFVVPLIFLWSAWAGVATGGESPLLAVVGQLLLRLAVVNNIFNAAKTRSGPRKIARRKELIAAKRYFESELGKPAPRMKDAWFPWVAAFGLGPDVDKWFRAFGGASSYARTSSSSSSFSGSSSSSSSGFSGESGGFTGGGGFSGGAGSSGSWAVAAGALAAGVSAPSSSGGGGGGGGGGGSSGGGGGGGW